ncbi:pentapeptide repeat-containing protein [Leptolyngbya sp. FACHB-321]|uniref:pentapeptide repeat-containing protein n=1 Tax=Leptolyngbya sp. FACHB-321 TaxID=2692807 RepID=UPI0018EF487B
MPLSLAILGYWLQQIQQKRTEAETKEQHELAEEENREEVLQGYFDRLSVLLIDKNLLAIAVKVKHPETLGTENQSQSKVATEDQELLDSAVDIIRARTLSILRRFQNDSARKTSVIRFLIEADIISKLRLNLRDANLERADLSGANLERANLSGVKLNGANLSGAKLNDAVLFNTGLERVDLRYADLRGADLRVSAFWNANLSGADLRNADLRSAMLIGTNLSGTNLSGANLGTINLQYANLSGAILLGVNLQQAVFVTQEQLKENQPPLLYHVALDERFTDKDL